MMKFIRKLTSRKFLAAMAGLIVGIAAIFGADADTVRTIAGAVVSLLSVVSYIVTEGRIDATCLTQIGADAGVIVSALDAVTEEDEQDV